MSQTDARGTDKARSTKQQLQTWRTATANGHRYFTFAGWFSRYAINSVPVTWHLIDARRHGDITNVTKTTVLHNSCLCQLLPTEAHASLKGIFKKKTHRKWPICIVSIDTIKIKNFTYMIVLTVVEQHVQLRNHSAEIRVIKLSTAACHHI